MGQNGIPKHELQRMPKWKYWAAIGNPPSDQRKEWRREYRTKMNRAFRLNPEAFIALPENRVNYAYDWY